VPTWNLRTGSHTLAAIRFRSQLLSAFARAGPTVVAMMGGVSLRKPRKVPQRSGGLVALVLDPDGPGDARELVGERAGSLVVVGALLDL
jgi:hypothetical protein